MSKWTDTVTAVYKQNLAKNSSYKFKQAMKDARKVYKKGGPPPSDEETKEKEEEPINLKMKRGRKHTKGRRGRQSGRQSRKNRGTRNKKSWW